MDIQKIVQKVLDPVSHEMAFDVMQTIWEKNRFSDFRRYNETAQFVIDQLHGYGLHADRLDVPMDGETSFGDLVPPLAWKCDDAVLEVVSPQHKALCTKDENPNLVAMWSPPSPPGGLEGEVVYVPDADPNALEMHNLSGKFLLTNVRPNDLRNQAKKLGALGIISFWFPYPNPKDAVQWVSSNSSQPGGWGVNKGKEAFTILAISPRMGEELAQKTREETVRLRAVIKSELYKSKLPIVQTKINGTHVIQGTDENVEVILLAPLYGQGANEHAASAAALVEAARVIQSLIDERALLRPMRAIRFLWVPRLYGPVVYAHKRKEVLDRTVFALCLDAGAGNPDFSWSRWSYRFGPLYKRHYSDGLAWNVCKEYLAAARPQRFIEQREFLLQSEVFFNDPALNVPTHWLTGGTTEECRNTSLDTPETIDRRSLVDLTVAAAATIYTAAFAEHRDVPQIAQWNFQIAADRLQEDTKSVLREIESATDGKELERIYLQSNRTSDARLEFETLRIKSLETLTPNVQDSAEWSAAHELIGSLNDVKDGLESAVRSAIDARAEQLGDPIHYSMIEESGAKDSRVPLPDGMSLGTITLDDLPHEKWSNPVKRSPRRNAPFILAWWLMDCKRTVSEIEELVRLENGPYRECLPVWFDFLRKHGYVEFEGEERIVDKQESEGFTLLHTAPHNSSSSFNLPPQVWISTKNPVTVNRSSKVKIKKHSFTVDKKVRLNR